MVYFSSSKLNHRDDATEREDLYSWKEAVTRDPSSSNGFAGMII